MQNQVGYEGVETFQGSKCLIRHPEMKSARWLVAMVLVLGWGVQCIQPAEQAESLVVKHTPKSPRSGEKVLITIEKAAKIESANVEYQVVLPGNYVALKDAAYGKGWSTIS